MNQMSPILKSPATYQDVLDAPENMIAELILGSLHMQPRPRASHGYSETVLSGELSGPFNFGRGGPGGWWIISEPECHLGENVLVPDLGGWKRSRMASLPGDHRFLTPPDWVCEILSPLSRKYDLTDKRDIYAAHGVSHIWFVDPDARTLEAFELRDGEWVLIASLKDDAAVSVAPFDAISFGLDDLWA